MLRNTFCLKEQREHSVFFMKKVSGTYICSKTNSKNGAVFFTSLKCLSYASYANNTVYCEIHCKSRTGKNPFSPKAIKSLINMIHLIKFKATRWWTEVKWNRLEFFDLIYILSSYSKNWKAAYKDWTSDKRKGIFLLWNCFITYMFRPVTAIIP